MAQRNLLRRIIPVDLQLPIHLPNKLFSAIGGFRFCTWLTSHGMPVKDPALYRPLFSPWWGELDFEMVYQSIRAHTLVSRDRCYILRQTLQQALHLDGAFVECGVFRGGTALLAAQTLQAAKVRRELHLFDSFQGMPTTSKDKDRFQAGDFCETSLEVVQRLLQPYPSVEFHPGFIPQSFAGLDLPRIAWAHVDVDLYQSVKDCIEYIYPRLSPGGVMIFDDYGFASCPGARAAVDELFVGRPEWPICLPTGQCMVIKLP